MTPEIEISRRRTSWLHKRPDGTPCGDGTDAAVSFKREENAVTCDRCGMFFRAFDIDITDLVAVIKESLEAFCIVAPPGDRTLQEIHNTIAEMLAAARTKKLMSLHAEALMQFQEASLLFTRHREELVNERRFWALEFAFTTTMSAIMGEGGENNGS